MFAEALLNVVAGLRNALILAFAMLFAVAGPAARACHSKRTVFSSRRFHSGCPLMPI